MTESLSVSDAKRRFSELIDRVGQGEEFVVTRHGQPAVALVSPLRTNEDRDDRPLGLLAFAGALADFDEELDEMVKDIYKARRRAKDRPPPDLD